MASSQSGTRRWAGSIAVLFVEWLIFFLLAVAATRPLATSWTTAIPQGTEPVATVPLFNLWTMGWNIQRTEAGLTDYWQAPIFHPAESAFAFSEPQPLMILFAPVLWCGGTLAAAYNLYLWLGLSLSGLVASRCIRWMTESGFAGAAAGFMIVMLPFVHWQSGVLQLVPLFGVLGTIYALARFGEKPTFRGSFALSLAFVVTYLLCNYYGLFLSLLLILSGVWLLGRNLWHWQTWMKLISGAALCLLLIGPMIQYQRQVLDKPDWDRDMDYVRRQSAKWGDFTATPWPQMLPIPEFVDPNRSGWTLSPGYLKVGLAMVGLIWGLCCRRLRKFSLFLLFFTALGVILAMGPRFQLGDWIPYEWIRDYYPGFKKARNAFRFVVFAQVGIVLLAGLGVEAVRRWLIGRRAETLPTLDQAEPNPDRSRREWRKTFVLAIAFLAVIEVWPDPQRLYYVPDYEHDRGWLDWVSENIAPDAPLACLPFPKGGNAKDYFGTTVWMYYALEHRRPILNGYSGFFPPDFLELKQSMADFPDASSLDLLKKNGARYLVVYRREVRRDVIERNPDVGPRLQWQFSDLQAEIDIYKIIAEESSEDH